MKNLVIIFAVFVSTIGAAAQKFLENPFLRTCPICKIKPTLRRFRSKKFKITSRSTKMAPWILMTLNLSCFKIFRKNENFGFVTGLDDWNFFF